tara:strand:+ start:2725 stop:3042 length:318 start_codon:yes stop_codon:yes gene_type:complete
MGKKSGGLYFSDDTPKGKAGTEVFELADANYDFLVKMYSDLDRTTENASRAQELLSEINYWDGPIDGNYSTELDGALKRYITNVNDEGLVMNLMRDAIDEMEDML